MFAVDTVAIEATEESTLSSSVCFILDLILLRAEKASAKSSAFPALCGPRVDCFVRALLWTSLSVSSEAGMDEPKGIVSILESTLSFSSSAFFLGLVGPLRAEKALVKFSTTAGRAVES